MEIFKLMQQDLAVIIHYTAQAMQEHSQMHKKWNAWNGEHFEHMKQLQK